MAVPPRGRFWEEMLMVPGHLIVQYAAFGRRDLQIGVPVKGPRPIGQQRQLIGEKRDGKGHTVVGDQFPQLMIE